MIFAAAKSQYNSLPGRLFDYLATVRNLKMLEHKLISKWFMPEVYFCIRHRRRTD
jgi:hypothetical protein